MEQKLSDYVIGFLAGLGVKHVFFVPGGGAMHLNNSLGGSSELTYVSNLHEQAAAIACEAYAKVTGGFGAALVTTGPGGTNAVTGVAGAWLDSTPCFFVSGQVKRADLKTGLGVRQIGVQEVDIVAIVSPITKYAVTVTEPRTIRYHLEKAAFLARTSRPGPVWIDIPLDVQAAQIDPETLEPFVPEPAADGSGGALSDAVRQTVDLLRAANRPVLLVGNGVRLAHAETELLQLLPRLGIPVLTTWLGLDLLPDSHDLLVGRPGAVAPRGPNFALQNADLLLAVGARLDLVLTGYSHPHLAPRAKKVMVDIDPFEIAKMKTPIDVPIVADAGAFLRELLRAWADAPRDCEDWRARCREWKQRYPVVLPEHRERTAEVSIYALADVLSEVLEPTDVIVSGSSGAGIEIFLLALRVKAGQRVLHTTALGAMGFGIASAIGGCLGRGGARTVVVDGDGGLQLNIQELQTVSRLQLPVKIFVLNNGGYASIRASQKNHFGRLVGADTTSGLTLPELEKIADAYGLPFRRIASQARLEDEIRDVLEAPGPCLCDVHVVPDEDRLPRISSRAQPDGSMVSTPLEDLYPFLPRDEFQENMRPSETP